MRFAKSIAFVFALSGVSASLYAQQPDFNIADDANFRESDRNGDGMLDADEWRVYIGEASS